MGRPKLLLPVDGRTVLEAVVSALRRSGVESVLVVVAPRDAELALIAESAGALVVRLDHDTPDMRATCLAGLEFIEQHFQPSAEDGWLLLPADHPTVRADIVAAVLAAAGRLNDQTIIVPIHQGRRGHPTWLQWSHVARLRQMPADLGINRYIREHAAETCELAWPSDEILRDLDTPEDYRRLLES